MIFGTKDNKFVILGKTLDALREKLINFNDVTMQGGSFGNNKKQLIPENKLINVISTNEATNIVSTLNNIKNGTDETWATMDSYLTYLSSKGKGYVTDYVKANQNQVYITKDVIKASENARKVQLDFNESIKRNTLSAKAGQVALKGLALAGNMLVSWGVSLAIDLAIKGIDSLVHAQENAIKAGEEALGRINETRENLKSTKQTIDEVSADYATLAQGVNALGENVSLTSEQYDKYNSIVDKIAERFPELVQGYTEEGHAILKNKGNVEELTKAYEAQKEAARAATLNDSETVFKGFKASFNGDPVSKIRIIKDYLNAIKANNLDDNSFEPDDKTAFVLSDIARELGSTPNDNARTFIKQHQEELKAYLRQLESKVDSSVLQVKPIAQAYLEQSFSFQGLPPSAQDAIKQAVNSFGYEFYSQFDNAAQMNSWIDKYLVKAFKAAPGLDQSFIVAMDMKTKFNNGEVSVGDYQNKLKEFLDNINKIKGLPDKTKKSLKLLLGITTDANGKDQSDIDEMFAKVTGKFNNSSIDNLEKNIEKLNINDLQFLSNLDISFEGVDNWSQVEEMLATIGPNSKKANDGLKSLSEDLKEVENSYALLNEVQKDFNSTGVISSDNIQKILSKFPDLEDELYEYIMGMRSGASVMDLIKSKSDNMASMSSEAFRKMFLSSNNVSDGMKKQFAASFGAVGLEWENTISVMANVNSQIIDANGNVTNSFSKQWNNACQAAGTSVSLFAQALGALFSGGTEGFGHSDPLAGKGDLTYTAPDGQRQNIVNTTALGIIKDIEEHGEGSTYFGTYSKYFHEDDKGNWFVNTEGTENPKKAFYHDVSARLWGQFNANKKNKEEFDAKQKELEEKLKSLGISNGSNGSSSNTLNYESPIDAVINRIKHDSDLVNKAIEETNKQLELIDMESDPEEYRKLVESKIQDQKELDSLYIAAQKELHKEADVLRNNGRYNIDSWFDEFGNATEKYYLNYNSAKTGDEQSNIKKLFDAVKKYKDSWSELQDKRQSAAKELLDSEKELVQCLERELEITKTLASAHNNSYSNQKTNIERDISNIEHLIEVSSSSAEKANLNSRLSDVYKRGIETAKQNMANVHSDADYWRGLLGSVLSDNGFSFDITKWFSESGDILEQFNADMNTITDETAKAEIRSYVDIISSKKSAYVEFYEWQQSMEKNLNASRKSALDELKDAVDELFDLRLKKIDSEKSLLEKHYSLTNSLAQEQHNLNKELLEAETTGARMNEHEKSLLFSKSEHAKLSSKLNQILGEANALQAQYTYDLQHATKNTIEEITNNYERQYDLKMKEYEIVRAELELAQAEQKLENVKNEKSVRTWNGSKWVYEAVLQDVIDAQNEVEDRKYDLAQAKIQDTQQKALNKLSATSDALTTEQNIFADSLARLSGEVTDAGIKLSNALQNIAETDLQLFRDILGSVGQTLSSTLNIKTDDIAKKVSQRESSGGSPAFILNTKTGTWTDVEKGTTTKASAESISKAKRSASSGSSFLGMADLMQKFSSAKEALSSSGTYGPTKSGSSSTAKKRKAPRLKLTSKKYADGTRNAENGLAYFDEEGDGSEVIITKYGKLRQFSSGETVFSKEATDRLYDMATSRSYNPFSSLSPSLPDPSQYVQNNKTSQDNRSYSINGITIQDDKGKELLKEVANYIWKKN